MRSIKTIFSGLLFLALALLVPTSVHAEVGTHLGEGDAGAQVSIMNTIIGNRPGFPVTIMADMGLSSETLGQLAEAARNNGLFPIVRINYACTVDSGEAIAMVNRVKAAFGDDVIITFGNEVNNGSSDNAGCTDWLRYSSNYRSVVGLGNISPSALDWYMGDDAYKAQLFLDTAGMSGDYASARIRTANAYGCINQTKDSCDPENTDTQNIGLQGTGGADLYVTEFSLSPGGDSPPDTNLDNVRTFIQKYAGSTGAIHVTPLVRNVCAELQSEGRWLIYVDGDFFTAAGTKVDTNCTTLTASGSGGYDLSDFPDYDINPDEYYLQPISGMLSGERDVDKIRKDLYSSGYEAYCAAENVEVKPKYNTSGLINRYLKLHEENPTEYPVVNIAVDSVASGDMTNAKVPIWRDVEGTKFLMSSLEEYFSFKDVYTQDPTVAELNSAPINSLLSAEQRCVQSAKTLLATELMCEKLLDPGKCALLSQTVPGTGKIIDNLREDMHKYMPTYRAGGISAECGKLYNRSIEHTDDEIQFRKDLNNVPLEINRSYRLAFLVIAIETKMPEKKSDSIAGKIFNFFTGKTEDGVPKHEVLVIGFKIPDIATNKGGGDDGGSVYWNDSAYLTRNVLLTREQIRDLEDNRRDIKRKQIGLQVEAAVDQDENSRIYCYHTEDGEEFPNGEGTPACQNELGKAVVDMVNGAAYGCDTKETEPVVQINDYAGFGDPKLGDVYKNEWGNTLLLNLFGSGDFKDVTHTVDNNYMDPQKAKTSDPWYEKIKTIWTIGPETWSPAESKTVVNYYLVYPMGFELKEIEAVMENTFFTSEQRDLIDQRNRVLDGWPIEGGQLGIAGGTASWDYPELLSVENCGTDATPEACKKHVSIAIETEKKGIGYLGARLGFWLRQIQLSLNSAFSQTHSYISSCPTLEHFLLGQCAGGSIRQVGDGTGTDFDYDTCGLKLGTGYCAPDYLEPFFAEAGFENPALEAEKASRICQRESGSSPYAFNSNCLSGKSVDYSVGLFQINMLPRCAGAFTDGTGVPDTASAYDPWKLPCHIVDQERLNECALSKVAIGSFAQGIINEHLPPGAPEVEADTLEQEKIKADNNIRAMVDLRKRWNSWQPWTAGAGNCSIE